MEGSRVRLCDERQQRQENSGHRPCSLSCPTQSSRTGTSRKIGKRPSAQETPTRAAEMMKESCQQRGAAARAVTLATRNWRRLERARVRSQDGVRRRGRCSLYATRRQGDNSKGTPWLYRGWKAGLTQGIRHCGCSHRADHPWKSRVRWVDHQYRRLRLMIPCHKSSWWCLRTVEQYRKNQWFATKGNLTGAQERRFCYWHGG